MPARPPHPGEQAAERVREAFGLDQQAPVRDIVDLIEQTAGVPVFLAPLPGDIAGLASRMHGQWFVVGDTTQGPSGRLRFTLAHELGHVMMGHAPSIDDEKTLGPHAGSDNETAANYFAAEMLLPRWLVEEQFSAAADPDDVDGCLDLVFEMASAAGTTPWVPVIRLVTLGLITLAHSRIVKNEIGTAIGQGREPHELEDIAGRYAGTGETRMPAGHNERLKQWAELDEDDDDL